MVNTINPSDLWDSHCKCKQWLRRSSRNCQWRSESDLIQNLQKYKPASVPSMQVGTFHPWHSILCVLKQCHGSDRFHSSHPRSHSEDEGPGSHTVKSEWIISKHYAVYPVLESRNLKFKLENESSVAVYQKTCNWFCCSDTRLGLTWYAHLVHPLLAQPWKEWSHNRAFL